MNKQNESDEEDLDEEDLDEEIEEVEEEIKKDTMEHIGAYVSLINSVLTTDSEYWNTKEEAILILCNDEKKFNTLFNSMLILGDVNLAKQNYIEYGLTGPTKYEDYGEQYLRLYGIYNSVYLEQQAILCLYKNLGIPLDKKKLEEEDKIFTFRKIVSHIEVKGPNKSISSYAIDINCLNENKVHAMTINEENKTTWDYGCINNQINSWNLKSEKLLKNYCVELSKRIKKKKKKFINSVNDVGKILFHNSSKNTVEFVVKALK